MSIAVAGCGSSQINSSIAPTRPDGAYRSVLVAFATRDLRNRELSELEFGRTSTSDGTQFIRSTSVVSIPSRLSVGALQELIHNHAIDAVLVLLRSDDPLLGGDAADARAVRQRLGDTDLTTIFNHAVADGTRNPDEPPMGARDPWVRFTALLYDVASGQMVWTATVRSEGMLVMPGELLRVIARRTVEQLAHDAMIVARLPS